MRNLYDVIRKILEVIPETEIKLIIDLRKVRNSLLYSAPELQHMWWNETYNILCDEVFNEDFNEDDWHGKVRRIFVGEEL